MKGYSCCSDTAIGFHKVSASDMYVYDYLIYTMNPYGFNDKRSEIQLNPDPSPDADLSVENGHNSLYLKIFYCWLFLMRRQNLIIHLRRKRNGLRISWRWRHWRRINSSDSLKMKQYSPLMIFRRRRPMLMRRNENHSLPSFFISKKIKSTA